MKDKKYGCLIFEDVFDRLNDTFDNESFGRVLRAALNYGFNGVKPKLENPLERYACSELTSVFDRNRESYTDSSINGLIGSAMRYAVDLDDFKQRIKQIEGLTSHDQFEQVAKFRNKYPDKCK